HDALAPPPLTRGHGVRTVDLGIRGERQGAARRAGVLELGLELAGEPDVVRVAERDVTSPRTLDRGVPRDRRTAAPREPDELDARVVRGCLLDDRCRAVARGVVDAHEVPVLEGLAAHAV